LALAVKKWNFCHFAKKKKSSTVRCVTVVQVHSRRKWSQLLFLAKRLEGASSMLLGFDNVWMGQKLPTGTERWSLKYPILYKFNVKIREKI
jgi:hypothetical protein